MQKGKKRKLLTGTLEVTRSGKGFLLMPTGKDDIPIPREHLHSALSKDIVEVELHTGRFTFGAVTKVLERARTFIVGTVVRDSGELYVKSDDARVQTLFKIAGGLGAPTGQKVVADVTNWDTRPPSVQIRRSLGMQGVHETEMRAILASSDFDADFPADVESEGEKVNAQFDALRARAEHEGAEAYTGRRDMRSVLTFTIDPTDAKDFDDAISFNQLEPDVYEIGVHIADVSHFVTPQSPLDREAVRRATSVYLVDRTIPMLPRSLSEKACSLVPNEDRLTFSVVYTFKNGKISDTWIGRTVIHSNRRLTYDEADVALANAAEPLHNELQIICSITDELRKDRIKEGSVIIESDEKRPILNEEKNVIGFKTILHTKSHELIEELMLLANKTVAKFVSKKIGTKNRILLYRVHDSPEKDRLEELALFVRALGYQLTLTGNTQREINKMLDQIESVKEKRLVSSVVVRSMAKAVYATTNIGHFGLAFKDYTHFTSPIRRYADLTTHRTLASLLKDEKPDVEPKEMELLGTHVSAREAAAAAAERASLKFKQVEYMKRHVGTTRTGTISGVAEFGVFISDDESGCDGLAHVSTLPKDEYVYDERHRSLVGKRSKHTIKLGDSVSFSVARVSTETSEVDYILVD